MSQTATPIFSLVTVIRFTSCSTGVCVCLCVCVRTCVRTCVRRCLYLHVCMFVFVCRHEWELEARPPKSWQKMHFKETWPFMRDHLHSNVQSRFYKWGNFSSGVRLSVFCSTWNIADVGPPDPEPMLSGQQHHWENLTDFTRVVC